jgi:hypothetical protein
MNKLETAKLENKKAMFIFEQACKKHKNKIKKTGTSIDACDICDLRIMTDGYFCHYRETQNYANFLDNEDETDGVWK